jgi:hypothetical protein
MQSKLGYHFNACECVKLERTEVYMVKDTFLFSLVAAQSLILQDPENCCRSQRLNNSDQKQAINKIGHQVVTKCDIPPLSTDG